MRTGANTVQQTLTPEAAAILKHAVTEACRRGHAQATPLHVAATLLGAPASPLRRACLQTHPHSSHPLQCSGERALQLCFNVALDRLQAAQGPLPGGQPSYSNALVAALKRAQAHQRRGYPEQQQQSLLAVKVELEQLVISILDDPSVSRVMREAGFSSPDVKNHLEDMVSLMSSHHSAVTSSNLEHGRLTLGASMDHIGLRLSAPPSILGNVAISQHQPRYNGFAFDRGDAQLRFRPSRPALYVSPRLQSMNGLEFSSSGGDDAKRVLEIFQRRTKKNPVLLGEPGRSAEVVIRDVTRCMERGDVPEQFRGVRFVSSHLLSRSIVTATREEVELKLSELNKIVEELMPVGVVIHVGDLQWLLESSQQKGAGAGSLTFCPVQYAVNEIGQMVARHAGRGRLWLFATTNFQTFLRCKAQYPCLEDQWDLLPVPISMSGLSLSLHPRNRSQEVSNNRLDSSLTLTSNTPAVSALKISSPDEDGLEKMNCCPECMVKYERELAMLHEKERQNSESSKSCSSSLEAFGKGTDNGTLPRSMTSAQTALPLWLQKALPQKSTQESGSEKANETVIPLVQKLRELRIKWIQTCQILHVHQHLIHPNSAAEQLQQPSPSSSQASGGTSGDGRANTQDMCDSVKEVNGRLPELLEFDKHSGTPCSSWLSSICQPKSQLSILMKSTNPLIGPPGRSFLDLEITQQGSASLSRENNFGDVDASKSMTSPFVAANDNNFVKLDLSLGRSGMEHAIATSPSRRNDCQRLGNAPKERLLDQTGCSLSKVGLQWQNRAVSVPTNRTTDAKAPSVLSEFIQPSSVSLGMFRQMDPDAFKRLCKGLADRVAWQKEVISTIANTVLQCRSGTSKRHGVSLKGDTWLLFLGPDRLGKRKMAKALAEIIFGGERKMICLGLGRKNGVISSCVWSLGLQELDGVTGFSRGRLPLDRLAEAVRLNPFSVLLLEDVDQCDSVIKSSLLQAMEKGRLLDSSGREVSFSNVIVVMTSSIGADCSDIRSIKNPLLLTENRLSGVPGVGLRLIVGDGKPEKVLLQSAASSLVVVENSYAEECHGAEQPSSSSRTKRKAAWNVEEEEEEVGIGSSVNLKKMKNTGPALALDLNLSADEDEVAESAGDCPKASKVCEGQEQETAEAADEQVLNYARKQLREFCDLVDAAVIFRPYDFEKVTETVLSAVGDAFSRKASPGSTLQIDVKALEQIIAAVWWASSCEDVLERWADEVLDKSLSMALAASCGMRAPTNVWKLLPEVGGLRGQELQPAALCLPRQISVQATAVAPAQP